MDMEVSEMSSFAVAQLFFRFLSFFGLCDEMSLVMVLLLRSLL